MDFYTPPVIPMSSPDLTEAERQAVIKVLNTPNLSMGPQIAAFEKAFCDFTGSRHAIAVNSGTSGLHLCVRAAGIEEGDWVITSPFSFVASTNAIMFEKAVPVFVDVDPLTGNIDPQKVEEVAHDLKKGGAAAQRWLPRKGLRSGGQLKAILAVDVYGQPADYDVLRRVSDEHGLRLIEDSCEALGSAYKGRMAGGLGDYGVFAFYPNKQITTGEGGLVVTSDDAAARMMLALRNQGRAPGDTWLEHTYLGYNYRMDELSAALGAVQMSRIHELLEKRSRVAAWYNERLKGIEGIQAPVLVESTTQVSWFVYVARVAPGVDREALAEGLKARGIPVRPYFNPIHLQPYITQYLGYGAGDFAVTEDLGKRSLALPFSGLMREDQVDQVCEAIRDLLKK
ncbi:MAG: DegT/DnrJ/EryC1/StrS family aminotransferase [Anaerolineae bacterium]|nr:DegT/DnrJ/EryC1/StrS family aminotransferase [Anaerolineae bacterium]